jgi:predicted nucleic acid-binding protein
LIACVESNFVLEIALGQEQAEEAKAILDLAERGSIKLSIPTFALSEPFSTITQRSRRRRSVYLSVTDEIRELGRSVHHQQLVSSVAAAMPDLLSADDTERMSLSLTIARILNVADVIPMDAATFNAAMDHRSRYGLDYEDAIILASIIRAMGSQTTDDPKCFISRNWGDFDEAGIRAELAGVGVTYLPNFRRGLEFCQPRQDDGR